MSTICEGKALTSSRKIQLQLRREYKREEIKNIAPCPPAATVDIDIKTRFHQLLNSCEHLKDRHRTVHHKISLRAKHLAEILDEFLKDDSDLLTINCVVYTAVRLLATPAPSKVAEKAELQTKRLDAKLKLERQLVTRIHCVIEYVNSGRRFTTKLRLVARSLKARYHTLNKNTLLTIKQHSLDKIRALTANRKKLVKRYRAVYALPVSSARTLQSFIPHQQQRRSSHSGRNSTSTHKHQSRIFTSFLCGTEPIPPWLTEGRTVLIPKKGDLSNPENYRPITCLNTVYKGVHLHLEPYRPYLERGIRAAGFKTWHCRLQGQSVD
ncbi:hypothetical protein L798_14892 [Zootermopsis nevadensis]|uniref:Uncharacterized protein n=1 Tax=Zootermopsis nevadensis TaxID=136037 RepID=A0A067QRN0_ZOONE|nr:hypothetical protein L798_14892 [Zootermopsis nevadensis]